MLKAIHAGEDIVAARQKAVQVIEKMRGWPMRPSLERILRDIRRRTRVVGSSPDGQSALNLATARPRHIVGTAFDQTLSEHRAAEGPADERCYHRLSQCRAPLSPNQMCEKLWTLPSCEGAVVPPPAATSTLTAAPVRFWRRVLENMVLREETWRSV
jgi:hypothetical protein